MPVLWRGQLNGLHAGGVEPGWQTEPGCVMCQKAFGPALGRPLDVTPDSPGQQRNSRDDYDRVRWSWRGDGGPQDVTHLHVKQIERVGQPTSPDQQRGGNGN